MRLPFFFFAIVVGFLISMEYGVTRPASQSLFLASYSSAYIPYAWLATVPLNYLLVSFYNWMLMRKGPVVTIGMIVTCVIAIHVATPFLISFFPPFIFFQYCWKDVYVLLMFKQLWSLVHSVTSQEKAKSQYGILFLMGTLGATLGSFIPGLFAVRFGTESLFYLTMPLYTCLFFAYRAAYQRSEITWEGEMPTTKSSSKEAFSMIRRSPYLITVLLLVLLMQASVGLMEYRFNMIVETQIIEKDPRTEYMGWMVSWINILGGCFHLGGSYLLVHFLGLRKSHLTIPLLLLGNHLSSLLIPTFGFLSFAYVLVKGVDYSVFSVLREMLYIPMKTDEKFRAKAIIDVFAYRSSKAILSLGILAFQMVLGSWLLPTINILSVVIFIAWSGVVVFLLWKHYPEKQLQPS